MNKHNPTQFRRVLKRASPDPITITFPDDKSIKVHLDEEIDHVVVMANDHDIDRYHRSTENAFKYLITELKGTYEITLYDKVKAIIDQ